MVRRIPHDAPPSGRAPAVFARASGRTSPVDRNALVDALGLACYIAYSYVCWDAPLLLDGTAGANGATADRLLLVQGAFTGIAALVLMFVWGRVAPLRRNLPALALFTFMEVAAVALAHLGQHGFAATLAVAGFALSGAGSAMRLGWEERMSVRGVRATAVRAALGYAIASVIYVAIVPLPEPAAVAVTAALPLVSFALLVWQERCRPDEGVAVPDPAVVPVGVRASLAACFERVPWRIPVFVALSYFCFGATRMDSLDTSLTAPDLSGALTVVVGMLACLSGIALAYASFRRSVQAGICIAVPLLAAAGLCTVVGVPYAGVAVFYVANVGVEITKYLMLFLMIDVIIKDGAPALLCLALLRFAQWGGSALGQAATAVVPSGTGMLVVMLLVLVVALLLVLGSFPTGLPRMSGRAPGQAADAAPADGGEDGRPSVPAPPASPAAPSAPAGGRDLAARVEEAARRYGLSPRETEVLGIWATGRSAAYVEKALFISQNTVKTHLNHIYSKTGTANRDELLELLDGVGPGS